MVVAVRCTVISVEAACVADVSSPFPGGDIEHAREQASDETSEKTSTHSQFRSLSVWKRLLHRLSWSGT